VFATYHSDQPFQRQTSGLSNQKLIMAPPAIIDEDEEYASSEDSDFAPDNAPIVAESESEDSEGEEPAESTSVKKPKAKPAKRKRGEEEAEDVGYENSGDEEIIGKGLKAKKRKAKKGQDEDDEGGEGGFVRTRAMKALAYALYSSFMVKNIG
jgi:hypothetical protein